LNIFVSTASFLFSEGLPIYFEFDVEQANLGAESGNKGLVCQEKDKRQGRSKSIYTYRLFHTSYANMSAHIYTPSRILDRRRRNNIRDRLHCRPQGQFTWDPGTPSSSTSSISASESKDSVSDHLVLHQPSRPRQQRNTMSLTQYSPTDDDEDYTSSDNDHLFMKDSPRRQSSTGSPPRSDPNGQPLSRSRTPSRSTHICVCRNPSAIASAASSAAAFSPVEPAIWSELRRLFHHADPRKHFDILRRSTPATDEQGNGFVLVEARVQAKDGSMVAKGEACTDNVLALRSLRNALMETKGERCLPVVEGEEIIAGRIGVFEKVCSACGLLRF